MSQPVLTEAERTKAARWLWNQQCSGTGGFRGSPSVPNDCANLINTYCALIGLRCLGHDLEGVDKTALGRLLGICQSKDGAFALQIGSSDADLRSTFAAFAIAELLHLNESFDRARAVDFIWTCQRYDGAFGQRPGLESHGGSTYCALASLSMAGVLEEAGPRLKATVAWLVHQQVSGAQVDSADLAGGFSGRSNKAADACYSFWISSSLKLLRPDTILIDATAQSQFLIRCHHSILGGFSREPGEFPDLYHTFLSLAALSLYSSDFKSLDIALTAVKMDGQCSKNTTVSTSTS